ncbi:cytochrome P450 [Amycolatopsis acidiphila]|uniref:Cytochrome P450 n=1 Tax=Amycolatopsis acidiphila TaxID=715473 RepID=A0A558ACC7_9PSEU|nr:cytochrome P450 [Amycolatopsis acidiphila]TVT21907.1 cytochrome P450 [Amycolatopsis acidiphila]UIJ57326.1 cytochrome P450 [Amycolatopsis acidiphila]GHG84791.1 cytochrome P450 [Amycolatopsis acidiphila]
MTEAPSFPMTRGRCPFDPPPELGRIRADEPVARVRLWDGSEPWLVTRYEDVRAVLTDPRISADSDRPGYPPPSPGIAARRRQAKAFINQDDPEHAAGRRLLTADFVIKKIERLRPRIQQIVDQLIDDLLAGPKPADLVGAFALPVPSLVICELLGVPYADRAFFHRTSKTLISRDVTPEQAVAATEELLGYLGDLVEKKAADPGDDVLSRLAVEQLRTGKLTRRELAAMGQLLLVAGHETTANMIALGTVALLENPAQLAGIRGTDDPALLANAVEELLRYLTIVHLGRRRVATEDLEIGGQLIRKGEGVIAATDAANRDDTAFPAPDELDLRRKARHHLAFGYGVHQCLGQPLARVELQVVYGTLYRRVPTLALAVPVEQLNFKHDMVVYGVHELPVTW